jgi:hypothetical protein
MKTRNTVTTLTAAALAALAALSLFVASTASAQGDKMGAGKMQGNKMTTHKTMSKGAVYVSKAAKSYFSEADAKKMGMKDPMGKPLVKMEKAPAGYKMMTASDAMKMHGKMHDKMGGTHDKMHGGKMKGGKMSGKPKM